MVTTGAGETHQASGTGWRRVQRRPPSPASPRRKWHSTGPGRRPAPRTPPRCRRSKAYAGRKPRINAYGKSFTECNQVSDGETWQEYLAGHFGEPIGNFGVGGYGVYQAYRRMLRVERTADGAQYVIFYVWGDDPARSIMRCRWGQIYPWHGQFQREQRLFNGNPCAGAPSRRTPARRSWSP
jgi:hypothetical protein